MFDVTIIRKLTHVQQLEVHQQLDSTNDRALELIRQNLIATPALIVTDRQTAGRGQRKRKWWSGNGSLTFSWIAPLTRANEENENANRLLPMATALAVADAVESVTDLRGIEIKWPNDLIVSGRKFCGILTETVSVNSSMGIVIGIGINVNNDDLTTKQIDTLEDRGSGAIEPTSVWQETHQLTSLQDLLIGVVNHLESMFELTPARRDTTVDRCNQRLAFHGQPIRVVSPSGETVQGTCERITVDGGLVVKSATGAVTVYSGTVSAG